MNFIKKLAKKKKKKNKSKPISFGQASIEEAIQKVWNERNQPVDCKSTDPRLGEFEDEMHSRQLAQEAMKSLHLQDEVEKTDERFVVT